MSLDTSYIIGRNYAGSRFTMRRRFCSTFPAETEVTRTLLRNKIEKRDDIINNWMLLGDAGGEIRMTFKSALKGQHLDVNLSENVKESKRHDQFYSLGCSSSRDIVCLRGCQIFFSFFSAFKFYYVEDLPPQGEASLETFLADFP